MKVLFLAAYSNLAAASRIKVYQFLPILEKRGIKCKVICFTPSFAYKIRKAGFSEKYLLIIYYLLIYIIRPIKIFWAILLAPKYDIIFVQEPIIILGLEKILKFANKNIVFLFTDAVFLGPKKTDAFLEYARKLALRKYWERLVKIARYCLVENDYNKKAVLKYCPMVDKIAGPMDTKKYQVKKIENHPGPIVIGWVGTFFTSKYLREIESALREVSKKYDIILRLSEVKKDFKIEGVKCEIIQWQAEKELELISSFDIGIMPLVDDEWARGKGGFKLLQYMSVGIPAVASPVGINNEIVQDGINGFLASSQEEWIGKISKIIESGELGRQMGHNARKTIEEKYSLEKATEKLIRIFNEVSK